MESVLVGKWVHTVSVVSRDARIHILLTCASA